MLFERLFALRTTGSKQLAERVGCGHGREVTRLDLFGGGRLSGCGCRLVLLSGTLSASLLSGARQIDNAVLDASAVGVVHEPDAEDVRGRPVEEEGPAVLELEVGRDRLEEQVERERVHHRHAVQGLAHALEEEERALDIQLFPLVLLRLEAVDGHAHRRVDDVRRERILVLECDQIDLLVVLVGVRYSRRGGGGGRRRRMRGQGGRRSRRRHCKRRCVVNKGGGRRPRLTHWLVHCCAATGRAGGQRRVVLILVLLFLHVDC